MYAVYSIHNEGSLEPIKWSLVVLHMVPETPPIVERFFTYIALEDHFWQVMNFDMFLDIAILAPLVTYLASVDLFHTVRKSDFTMLHHRRQPQIKILQVSSKECFSVIFVVFLLAICLIFVDLFFKRGSNTKG